MPGVAERLLRLRTLLPGADVSAMVAQRPELFLKTPVRMRLLGVSGCAKLDFGHALLSGGSRRGHASVSMSHRPSPSSCTLVQMPQLEASIASLHRHLPGVAVGPLVEREPMLLRANVEALLAEVERLMPVRTPGRSRIQACKCVLRSSMWFTLVRTTILGHPRQPLVPPYCKATRYPTTCCLPT